MKLVKSTLIIQLMLVCTGWAAPNTPDTNGTRSTHIAVQQLLKTTLNSTIVWDRLSEMTSKYGSRITGSPGLEKSTQWIVEHLKADGLDVHTEPVNITYWRPNSQSLTYLNAKNGPRSIPVVPLGRSASTPKYGVKGEIVAVTSLEELQALGREKIQGKIVLINEPWTGYNSTVKFRYSCGPEAEKYGAVGVIIASVTPEGSPNNLHTGLTDPANISSVAVTRHDAAELYKLYKDAQQSKKPNQVPILHLTVDVSLDKEPKIVHNIIADVRGRELPNEYVLVGGHIDSWFLGVGAVDDGAGAFTSWEAVRAIRKLPHPPKRTVRVVFWVDEEQGGSGSKQYLKNHLDEIDRYSLAIESDSGNFEPAGLEFSGSPEALASLQNIGKQFFDPRIGSFAPNVVAGTDPGADVEPLLEKGVPSAGLVSRDPFTGGPAGRDYGYFYVHHSPDDQVSFLKPDQLARNAAALSVWAYTVAEADTLLPRAKGNTTVST